VRESRADFGKELARLRTDKGVSLEDLASATKVRAELLQRLESGLFEALPPPIFVEGYLKACAHHLGTDPAPLLARYRALAGGAEPSKPTEGAAPAPPAREGSPGWLKGLAGLALLAGAGYAAYYFAVRTDRTESAVAPEPPSAVVAVNEAPAAATPGDAPRSQEDPPAREVGGASASAGQMQLNPETPEGSSAPADEAPAKAAEADHVMVSPRGVAAADALPEGELVLVASGPCWCEIWADGKRSLYREVAAGEKVGLQGMRFRVNLGNTGAVQLYYRGAKVALPSGEGRVLKDLEVPAREELPAP